MQDEPYAGNAWELHAVLLRVGGCGEEIVSQDGHVYQVPADAGIVVRPLGAVHRGADQVARARPAYVLSEPACPPLVVGADQPDPGAGDAADAQLAEHVMHPVPGLPEHRRVDYRLESG